MRVRFHEAAMVELAWEVQYYAKISPQLGERFATVVERALAIATEFPDMGSRYKYGTLTRPPQSVPVISPRSPSAPQLLARLGRRLESVGRTAVFKGKHGGLNP
jgi:hypothetical protein